MEKVLILFILIRNIIPYFILFEWKEEKISSIIKSSVFIICMLYAYFSLENILYINNSLLILITITIPSFIVFYFLNYHRDARYLLTFVMVDTISIIIKFLIDSFVSITNINVTMTLALYIMSFGVIYLALSKVGTYYRNLMNTIDKGLGVVTTISLAYYVILYFCISNPTIIENGVEYLSICVVFCVMIIFSYIVIFRTLTLIHTIYEFKDKEGDLTSQLKLQESEIELKELYYKLAYVDVLTNLKNRTAYEEKLTEIQVKSRRNQKIWYISLDLNDLKFINDRQGHHRGDLLIQSMASALKIVFSQYGHIFRIGGDEFVVIVDKQLNELDLQEKLNELDDILNDYGKSTNMNIKVAWGYTLYTSSEKDTIVEAAIRADALMYSKKRSMKKSI